MINVTHSVSGDASVDLDVSIGLLDGAVKKLWPAPLIRIYRPAPTVAFTTRERHLSGFTRAFAAAADAGFVPLVRRTGGRVAAYDRSCLLVDIVEPPQERQDHRISFQRVASTIASVLRQLGVEANVGEVPGEYCPGGYSVNARGVVKLVGISQRVSREFRLVSSMIAVDAAPQLSDVLTRVNRELCFEWNPDTFGSAVEENHSLTFEECEQSFLKAFTPDGALPIRWADLGDDARLTRTGTVSGDDDRTDGRVDGQISRDVN